MKRMLLGNEALALGAYMAGVVGRHGLSRHAEHRDPGVLRQLSRRLRRVVTQREGGDGGGRRRGDGRRAHHRDDEARRAERGRRSLLRGRLHGDPRRAGRHLGRRSRHALLAGRAGQPQLRQVRQSAAAGAGGQPGMRRYDARRAGDQRAVRYAGAPAHDGSASPTPSRWWRWMPSRFKRPDALDAASLSTETPAST